MAANTLFFSVIGKSLEKFSEEAIKHGGPALVAAGFAGPLAGASAAILSYAVPALVSAMFEAIKENKEVEKKLDALIEGPFNTAEDILDAVLRGNWRTDEQKQERRRMLSAASDRLFDAYGIAENVRPELAAPIRVLHAVVLALRPEAQPIFENVIQEYRGLAAGARVQAYDALERAKGLDDERIYIAALQGATEQTAYQIQGTLALSIPMAQQGLRREAETLTARAAEIDRFCTLLLTIATNRDT